MTTIELHSGETITVDTTEQLLEIASGEYSKWYDAEPVVGEEDSPSHDYVREIVPLLIEALATTQSTLIGQEAQLELVRIHVKHEFVDGHESPVDLQEVMSAPPRDVLAGFETKITDMVHARTRERAARLVETLSRNERCGLDDLVESVRALEATAEEPSLARRFDGVHAFSGSMPASLVKSVANEVSRITHPSPAPTPEGTSHD